jgi:hypothetical protein
VPRFKAAGMSYSVVQRSYYILVLNIKQFMCLYSFYLAIMFIIVLRHRLAYFMGAHVIFYWHVYSYVCLQCFFGAVNFVFKT